MRIAATVAAWLVSGCTAATPSVPTSSGSSPVDSRPIAPDIAPVSQSNPGPDAQVALDACLITDSTHRLASTLGVGIVEGMGEVVPAHDVSLYVPLTGREPEVRTDAPAWVIATRGVVTIPFGDTMRNPTCVVVEGRATWFVTDASSLDGDWVTAAPLPLPPTYRLPPLGP
jgi:hypothetical protein